ncbi:MAG: alpha/beta fold hydrolase [Novosphingobium sp.]
MGLHHGFAMSGAVRLHYVEAGAGPAVIFCHGFPEFWYSWRHQMQACAQAGHRAIALDMRGHGQSDAPDRMEEYSVIHTVGDVIALMNALEIGKAVIVGHDAGTTTAYHAGLMRPDRFRAVVGLSVPYIPRGEKSVLDAFAGNVPPGFYMQYFQQPGIAERDLEADVESTLRRLFFANSGSFENAPIMMLADDKGLVANLPDTDLPIPFLTGEELAEYVACYRQTGFRGGLNGYRVFGRNWELTSPWAHMALSVPAMFVGGTRDTVLHFPGFMEAARNMATHHLLDGAGHWVQMERAETVNALLIDFLDSLPTPVAG